LAEKFGNKCCKKIDNVLDFYITMAKSLANKKHRECTLQQLMFVSLYLANGYNATEAARGAKYSEASCAVQGARLLKNDKIRAEIERRTGKPLARLGVTRDRVIEGYAEFAFNPDKSDFVRLKGLDGLAKCLSIGAQQPQVTNNYNQLNIGSIPAAEQLNRFLQIAEVVKKLQSGADASKTLPNGAESILSENRYHDTIEGEIVDCRASGSVLLQSGNPSLEPVRLTDNENGGNDGK